MRIELDDPARPDVLALLEEHLRNMRELSPPESVHALDVSGLKSPDITFWTVRESNTLLGCGALKELDAEHGEVKSMRTPATLRRRGVGRAILRHIVQEARARGYRRLSLETGSMEAFAPAQRLYESFGFTCCGPFAGYKPDPNSVFMTLLLQEKCGTSAYGDALVIDADSTADQLTRAAGILASGGGMVMLEGIVALRPTRTHLYCEVVDPTASARRCEREFEVLVENAQRTLHSSRLKDDLPDLPRRWRVVEDRGTDTVVLWQAP